MAVLAILLIGACGGVALLLVCLKGFTGELRRKKISSVMFVTREEPTAQRPQEPSKTLIDFSPRKTPLSKDPAIQRVSNGTVALVGAAILLRSRSVCSDAPTTSSNPVNAKPGQRPRPHVPGVQPCGSF